MKFTDKVIHFLGLNLNYETVRELSMLCRNDKIVCLRLKDLNRVESITKVMLTLVQSLLLDYLVRTEIILVH